MTIGVDSCECHETAGFCYAKTRDTKIHDCHCTDGKCEGANNTCTNDLCSTCVSDQDLESIKTCVTATNNPCVSTAWLLYRGVAHATLRDAGVSPVLCIPGSGLPCGTAGHLLREKDSLVSYREVCEKRSDCVQSTMKVSQLSHTFDWSVYQSNGLELTSLSAHPNSAAMSPSRMVAKLADALNRVGLGAVTNAVAAAMNTDKFVPTVLCSASSMA